MNGTITWLFIVKNTSTVLVLLLASYITSLLSYISLCCKWKTLIKSQAIGFSLSCGPSYCGC
uniref:Uncharacterized protein n=1 Tax=Anguilla anguilla TaxID=7936 RepID=A0A0E9RHQ5_ANGAN